MQDWMRSSRVNYLHDVERVCVKEAAAVEHGGNRDNDHSPMHASCDASTSDIRMRVHDCIHDFRPVRLRCATAVRASELQERSDVERRFGSE